MRTGVLAWGPKELESLGISETFTQRGHDNLFFEIDDIHCTDTEYGMEPTVCGRPLRDFDVIVSRAKVAHENWRENVERLFLLSSVPEVLLLDPVDVHMAAACKFTMIHRLTRAGVPVPPTRACRSLDDIAAACDHWGAIVLKPSSGFGGHGVERFLHGLTEEATAKASALLATYGALMCQPYLEHEGDVRVTVVGDSASACVHAHTAGEHWRPHLHTPGTPRARNAVERIDPPPHLVELAVRATRAVGLSTSGVDILYHRGEPVVIEVNNCPGWDGDAFDAESRSLVDRHVVEYAERRFQAERGRPRREP